MTAATNRPPPTYDGPCLAHLGENGKLQLLVDHLSSVSRKAAQSAAKIAIAPAGKLVGLVHDLGKYSALFQHYLRTVTADQDTEQADLVRGKVDHSTVGAQLLWNAPKGKTPLEGAVAAHTERASVLSPSKLPITQIPGQGKLRRTFPRQRGGLKLSSDCSSKTLATPGDQPGFFVFSLDTNH